jgi:3-oxoadipate enol-lactonase
MKAVINNCLHHYIDIGISTAIPVIFIHGFPFSHKMWTFTGGQTESIATTYRVIAYDIRGHGDSEIGDGQFTLEMFVDDLFGLMDHLNITRAVLVGFSMGGYIALRAAERNPERIRALVLCDTRSEADSNEAYLPRKPSMQNRIQLK